MSNNRRHLNLYLLGMIFIVMLSASGLISRVFAQSSILTVTPLTWNIIGLDSNNPTTGPRYFPIGAEVCNTSAGTLTNIPVTFQWQSANAFINLRPGSLTTITIPSLTAGACYDAYFEIEITQNASAFDTFRQYAITAFDGVATASTPQPRALYVEHLISQNRNATTGVLFGPNVGSLTSVPAGGSMNLLVGETYVIRLTGGTATQGYEQLESFLTLSNTIFQILDVQTTYSADTSPYVSSPNPSLYADACLWQNDPNSPIYRNCIDGGFKTGGTNVNTTYTVRILSGGGTTQTLNSLLYDFSGSSFHYNSDFSSGVRYAAIIDPTTSTIAKSFTPNSISTGGISTLVFTLTNPNGGAISGYNFVDNLPAGMTVANPPQASTSACGTPTFAPSAGSTSLNFTNGTIAANGTCTISVKVTATTVTTYNNMSNHLFINSIDTGRFASASLTVTSAPPAPACVPNLPAATWNFLSGSSNINPAPTTINVASAIASAGSGLVPVISTENIAGASGSWSSDNIAVGALNTANNEYFEFAIDTTGFASLSLSFQAQRTTQGAQSIQLYYGTTTPPTTASTTYLIPTQNTWTAFGPTTISPVNPTGITYIRLYVYDASLNNNGHAIYIDGVNFTGCGTPQSPTMTKAFAANPIGVNGTSTLTFTLVNPNSTIGLTGVSFSDTLPSGLTVANPTGASSTCGGTWTPTIGATTLNFSGGNIAMGGTCTVQVNVTASAAGPRNNISGFISSTQTGTNNGIGGSASATLTVLAPPLIDKQFTASPILAGGASTLIFTITNPNQNNAISGVAFTDTFPVSPGSMVVANPSNATSTCGGTFTANVGAGSVNLSGGSIAAGASCTLSVRVTAPAVGTYNNTTGNVSHIVNGQTFNGNTTSDTLLVSAPNPSITILKQIGTTPGGPWFTYVAVPTGASVYYRLTVENTGDVPLSPITVTDPNVNTSSCAWTNPLPAADAFDDDHITTCIIGPISAANGTHPNIATANGTYSAVVYTDTSNTATYATTALSINKTADRAAYTTAGEVITYTFTVQNTGFATLSGPVTINDSLTTNETCPALTTVGDGDNFLDPGETIVCTATYTIIAADLTAPGVTNTATATAGTVTSAPSSVTVNGPGPSIVATDDDFSATPINSLTGGSTATVYSNDTLNGAAFLPAQVTPSITADGGLTGVTINPDGTLSIPASTPANTYTVTYQICEVLNATNCDTATVTVVVNSATIVATNDDFSAAPINSLTGGSTATVYSNDTLNGAAFLPAQVTPSITANGGLTGVSINPDGTLSIPASTPANTYTVTYQICEVLNATNCDTATVTVVVSAATIVATNDDFSAAPINSLTGGSTATVYSNDTLNGAAFLPAQVTATITANGGLTGVTINPDGTLSIPASTPANTYIVTYQICEVLNATNCDTATVTVVVNSATIVATNDDFSAAPINSLTGGSTATVYSNDTLNGAAFLPAQVTPTITANGGLTGVTINPDGTLSIPAGTPANTYTITYQICEVLNATNCDTATVTVVVNSATIVATDDDFSAAPINSLTGGSTATVYTNDTLNGAAFLPAQVTPSITANGGLTGVTINPDGTLSVPAGTPANTYTVTYQICEVLNATNCDTATVTVVVSAATIVATDDDFSAAPINSLTGGSTATVYTNDTLNGAAFLPAQVTPTITANGGLAGVTINPDGTLSIPASTPANTYTVTYQICEVLNATNCDTATVTVVVAPANLTATDDDFSAIPVNSITGGSTATVYTNDTRNGAAFTPAQVTPSITADGGLTGVTINPDGTLSIPAGIPANTYTVTYQICEVLNPTNCDTATVTVVVAAANLTATDDDFSAIPVNSITGGSTATVYTNDTRNGATFTPAQVTPSITADGGLTGVAINPDGTLGIPASTPANTYTVTYQICEVLNPTNCDTATVVVITSAIVPIVEAGKRDSLVNDVNGNGLVDNGDSIGYTVVITNIGTASANNVLFTDTPDVNTVLVNGSVTTTQGAVVSGNGGETTVGVDIGIIAAGGNVSISYRVVVNVIAPGGVTSVANSATVQGSNFLAVRSNDPDTPTTNDPTTTLIQPLAVANSAPQPNPVILYFDPAISKIGFLEAGQLGLQDEQITWFVTVVNNGNVAGTNIVVSDTIRPELRIDAVNVPAPLTTTVNGQTVIVTIPSIAPGDVINFSIVTTVTSGGGMIENTACMSANGITGERCAVGSIVASLPQTGETPVWRALLIYGLTLLSNLVFVLSLCNIRKS